MGIKDLYQRFLNSTGVTTDTRKIKNGNIFFALKGERFNGNRYATKALEEGASYVVVDEVIENSNEKYILVDDVLSTLQELSTYHRDQFSIPVLAITGSNGKTTTKELVREVLSTTYKVHCTVGNFNNHIGVPLTLLDMPLSTEVAIIEMGANHQKEIEFLCHIAHPTMGLVTNVGKAHLEGFGGVKGIIKGKGELYDYLGDNEGLAFVNNEEEYLKDMSSKCKNELLYDSVMGDSEVKMESSTPFLKVSLNEPENFTDIQTQLIGNYNYPNILTAIRVGKYFDVSNANIKKALQGYLPENNRSQLIERGTNKIILDAYNANPTSMKAALSNFVRVKANYRIAIIGDMLELGEESEKEHQDILDFVQSIDVKEVITVGKEFRKVNKADNAFLNVDELKRSWDWSIYENVTFLIKGSRGIRLEQLL